MIFRKFIYLSMISISLILSSCNASSDNSAIIQWGKKTYNSTPSQSNVAVPSKTDAHIITSDNYMNYFSDSSQESSTPESCDSTYRIYNNVVWTATYDLFVADIIPGKGKCLLAPQLEDMLRFSSFPENQLVGVWVYEWSSFYDNTLSKNDIISIFADFGFETEYTTDETIRIREQEYINSIINPERHFTIIGDIQHIKSFIERCLSTDESYILHLAPCLYGVYSEESVDLKADIIPDKGEIHLDDTLFDLLFNADIDRNSLYAISVKCWSMNSGENNDIEGLVDYMKSMGFDVLYYKKGYYYGTTNQIKYINGSDFDMVIRGTFNTIQSFINNNLETEYSFSFYSAYYIY